MLKTRLFEVTLSEAFRRYGTGLSQHARLITLASARDITQDVPPRLKFLNQVGPHCVLIDNETREIYPLGAPERKHFAADY